MTAQRSAWALADLVVVGDVYPWTEPAEMCQDRCWLPSEECGLVREADFERESFEKR